MTEALTVLTAHGRPKPRSKWISDGVDYRGRQRGHVQRDETRVKSRLYVHPADESVLAWFATRVDAVARGQRTMRPVAAYRTALPEIFARLGIPADTRARWDNHAGCRCSCSPGFVLDRALGFDYWAEVTAPDSARYAMAGIAVRMVRAAATSRRHRAQKLGISPKAA